MWLMGPQSILSAHSSGCGGSLAIVRRVESSKHFFKQIGNTMTHLGERVGEWILFWKRWLCELELKKASGSNRARFYSACLSHVILNKLLTFWDTLSSAVKWGKVLLIGVFWELNKKTHESIQQRSDHELIMEETWTLLLTGVSLGAVPTADMR